MYNENLKTDFYYFDEKGKRVLAKDGTLLNNFLFKRNDFFLISYLGIYDICVNDPSDDEMVAIWNYRGDDLSPREIMSRFRNEFVSNGIDDRMIDKFLRNPKRSRIKK